MKRSAFWSWCWVDSLSPDKPDPEGERAHAERLAGQSVTMTLSEAILVYALGVRRVTERQRDAHAC